MTKSNHQPSGAHLVGSVPLSDASAVFETTASILGQHLHRLPDGETGSRTNWISWQYSVLATMSPFEPNVVETDGSPSMRQVKLRSGVSPADIKFGSLGYSDAAKSSYAEFSRLKQAGVIATSCRFQVCLPTPLAPIAVFVAPQDQAAVEPAYEARLLAELDDILCSIPHDELAIQWDTAVEFAHLEGVWPVHFTDVRSGIIERLIRLGTRVPSDVELGYHLCYGDSEHKHFIEPADTTRLVDVANAIAGDIERPLHRLHLPVPQGRTDEAYFAPLKNLKLQAQTELYLGLVHLTDGVEGAKQRIAAAQAAVSAFGVATECGFGRRPADTIPELLQIHAEISNKVR